MAKQTLRPRKWVVVNDGSTDNTGKIIDEAASKHSWIVPVHRPDRGFRQQGGGVVETFRDGFKAVEDEPWEYLVKFDADLSFDDTYFESCLKKFSEDKLLGIGGGMIVHDLNGKLVCESPGDPDFHVRGATKIYSRECWHAIGGLIQAPGWDTIDELKANMLGYKTYTFTDIYLRHHRATGSVDGAWKDSVKNGKGSYITGYHPLFMFAKCVKRVTHKPYFVRAFGLGWGFFGGYVRREKQLADPQLVQYIRRQQLNKLMLKPSLW